MRDNNDFIKAKNESDFDYRTNLDEDDKHI